MEQSSPQVTTALKDYYLPGTGLSWFDGISDPISDNPIKVTNDLWLPNESQALINLVNEYYGVTVIGEIGAGKSAVLYGLRALLKTQNTPYYCIDGHYTNTPDTTIIDVINQAEDLAVTLIIDSADYLSSASTKIREFPLGQHLQRNQNILERLALYRKNGGKLLLTSHSQNWFDSMAHPELLQSWQTLNNLNYQTEIAIYLDEREKRRILLDKMGLDSNVAEYFSSLPQNPNFIDYIVNTRGSKRYVSWAHKCLTSYPYLKLLAKDHFDENLEVQEAIKLALSEELPEEAAWEKILTFVFSKTYRLLFFTRR